MAVVVPTSATATGVGGTSVGTAPYVDTRDADSSYVTLQATAAPGTTWRLQLPATQACSDATGLSALVEARYVAGTGSNPSPESDTSPTVALQRWTGSVFQFLTTAEFFAEHYSFSYTLDDIALTPQSFFGFTVATVLDELAAGNLYITLFQQFAGGTPYQIRVTYAALNIDCPTVPRLRQRQRDDLRQRQSDSRQLTARQRGYF